MALKRKRSSPGFSSPSSLSSDSTTQSSPLPSFYHQSKPIAPFYQKPTWSFPTYDDTLSSQHLNSRTRKRHRDNRPDEEQIHASTIDRLYQAQRQHPDASPVLSQPVIQAQQPTQPQRSTLHSFWRIGQPPAATMMVVDSGPKHLERVTTPPNCEDCDRPLRAEDAMDVDEYTLNQETRCASCERSICDTCAILGTARTCLACASRGY
ncbi:hypothetical protein CLAFUW4_02116 [Fulvia fulva]|uniref:Uncharacterized protein n=1 Tax=Passalora fulva TaxID=5499 RepID=A0A9Q8L726_PASFU|nr:uncharacterized protein CLAFUR5_02109 [Fulvia fulva]KAK4634963.1 hypothetical protein CLAFUR4_02112 [Fulvia fulva]KAK4637106.1 hypothetical protein CLAFUR0_02115 [Fulvia fulva]UJO11997.1 hypothetical protein CLAFUR5_02109 [Fulvia fulva]WPV08816.1 hypothetical protein CLAFUW4_02116 [Fulvia fulva]WPV23766.1 hypothetical protein CLAFUW7_02116 [Fulvia fulva]